MVTASLHAFGKDMAYLISTLRFNTMNYDKETVKLGFDNVRNQPLVIDSSVHQCETRAGTQRQNYHREMLTYIVTKLERWKLRMAVMTTVS